MSAAGALSAARTSRLSAPARARLAELPSTMALAAHPLVMFLACVATVAAGSPNCTAGAASACPPPVCAQCCKTWKTPDLCAVCVEKECAAKPPPPTTDVCARRTPADANSTCAPECVEHCAHKPWSPCMQGCDLCTAAKPLFIAVLLPFFGRSAVDWLLIRVVQRAGDSELQRAAIGAAVACLLSGAWAIFSGEETTWGSK